LERNFTGNSLGSVRLKSYAGRSLFNGLLSAPATRKRSGILDILDNFLDSRFILIGDTGEQDLELYAALAKERPQQILAVFVRDVSTSEEGTKALHDPTGLSIMKSAFASKSLDDKGNHQDMAVGLGMPVKRGSVPVAIEHVPPIARPLRRSMSEMAARVKPSRTLAKLNLTTSNISNGSGSSSSTGFFTSSSPTTSPKPISPSRNKTLSYDADGSSNFPTTPPGSYFPEDSPTSYVVISEQERKKAELQMRVYKARAQMPPHVYLRVFRKAEECVEGKKILDELHVGHPV